MADKNIVKAKKAQRRQKRIRGKISGTPECPRLTVAKSLNNVFAQIIDDVKGVTLLATATNSKAIKDSLEKSMTKTQKAHQVGLVIAELAKEKGITKVVFDRNKSRYHGRVKAVADGAREGGLKF
ncbi:MAG: 50S ribosomal protein L18 [FCB group bacterium]|nr:50S ribosomal protein L18 [FCB group bacterium]